MSDNLFNNLGGTIDEIKSMDGALWQMFAHSETKQIGEQFYMTEHEYGIGLVFNGEKHLISINLHDGTSDFYHSFKGRLPCDLNFSDNMVKVHQKIGVPIFDTGGGEVVPILGYMRHWIKYKIDNYYVHLEFHNRGESIALITIPLAEQH